MPSSITNNPSTNVTLQNTTATEPPQASSSSASNLSIPHSSQNHSSITRAAHHERALDSYSSNIDAPAKKTRTLFKNPLSAFKSTPENQPLQKTLKNWVNDAPDSLEKESRQALKEQVVRSFNDKNQTASEAMNLYGRKVSSLPDIFRHPHVKERITSIEIEKCHIERLPASLLNLPKLEVLNLNNNNIGELPEIGDMPSLRSLNLSDNTLTSLPDSIGKLTDLKRINLENNQLAELPSTLSNLTQLQSLTISRNPISVVPDALNQLPITSLKATQMNWNTVPSSVTAMKSLTSLALSHSPINTLSPEIGQLSRLNYLELDHMQLTSLPEEIRALPNRCHVNLTGNHLSQNVVSNLMAMREQGGPRIEFSIADTDEDSRAREALPLVKNVNSWIRLDKNQEHVWNSFEKQADTGAMNLWLARMPRTAENQNTQTRAVLHERMKAVLSHITDALVTNDMQRVSPFVECAEEATSSCRDRISVGLDNMEMIYHNQRADAGHYTFDQLKTLGKELFIKDQATNIATEKARKLMMVDEVEVHLAYQTGIKSALHLTLGNSEMLYQACSQVTSEDIKDAVASIKQTLEEKEPLAQFLAQWTPVKNKIIASENDEYLSIQSQFESKLEHADQSGDYKTLNELGTQREQAIQHFLVQHILNHDL